MPSPLTGKLTIADLLRITYQYMGNRFDNAERDFVKLLKIQKVTTYDGKKPGEARTRFVITSQSMPQYSPYFKGKDSRGRTRGFQRLVKHQYDVTLQLDRLSVNVPVKLRTGADKKMLFGPGVKAKFDHKGKLIQEDKNVLRGRNADFFFRCEWVYHDLGILFGRNHAGWPPVKTNKFRLAFLDKHALTVILTLIKMGKLKK